MSEDNPSPDDISKAEPEENNNPEDVLQVDYEENISRDDASNVQPEDVELEPNGNTKPMDHDNGHIEETAVDMDNKDDDEPHPKAKLNKIERAKAREILFFMKGTDRKRIDYVIAYTETDKEDKTKARRVFEDNLAEDGIALEYEDKSLSTDGKTYYLKLSADWESLSTGAELLNMKKRLKMPKGGEGSSGGCCVCDCTSCCVVPDNIVHEDDDFFTMAFSVSLIDHFDIDLFDPASLENFFTNAERSLILGEILNRTAFTPPEAHETRFGIQKLINEGIYTAAFPLHEGRYRPLPDDPDPFTGRDKDRARLYEAWARPGRWYCYQPLDLIRKYFGEKIGIYFAWLGFYTSMLIPASIAGVAVFIYGLVTMPSDPPSNEICDKDGVGNFTMCPQCDERCTYWRLHETSCLYSQITYVFDNYGSVAMATFMAVWATCFLEFWKRKKKKVPTATLR